MQTITKRIGIAVLILFISCCINFSLNAQTPADDPGIGGPGIGSAPAGDGAPTVPFSSTMNLLFLGSTLLVVVKFGKDKGILGLNN